MSAARQKSTGAYYTPNTVVRTLVSWAARSPRDRMLDPACGDGRFLRAHPRSVGVEQDEDAARIVHSSVPGSLIHQGDFFTWAASTHERFDCAAGNPPFIRYQRFTGEVRTAALELCARHGASFTGLASSWAPFLVATATLLKPGGRMSFVVPAEIGHAPYAKPVLQYMVRHFGQVHVVAIREKLFPALSEDCWLLHAEGCGERTDRILFSAVERFAFTDAPPRSPVSVPVTEWRLWNHRLRPWLLPSVARSLYQEVMKRRGTSRLGYVSSVGIGYVTGANDFFHLRPSEANRRGIPERLLRPAVRNGRSLAGKAITQATVRAWRRQDEPVLLLDLCGCRDLPGPVQRYLDSPDGHQARASYKCRNRTPWYVVPDVNVPDAFLSYMSGDGPSLVANRAACVATNSVHVVRLNGTMPIAQVQQAWDHPVTRLSCEIEGHPLGGGMLKLEPREAARVVMSTCPARSRLEAEIIEEAIAVAKRWRHYA